MTSANAFGDDDEYGDEYGDAGYDPLNMGSDMASFADAGNTNDPDGGDESNDVSGNARKEKWQMLAHARANALNADFADRDFDLEELQPYFVGENEIDPDDSGDVDADRDTNQIASETGKSEKGEAAAEAKSKKGKSRDSLMVENVKLRMEMEARALEMEATARELAAELKKKEERMREKGEKEDGREDKAPSAGAAESKEDDTINAEKQLRVEELAAENARLRADLEAKLAMLERKRSGQAMPTANASGGRATASGGQATTDLRATVNSVITASDSQSDESDSQDSTARASAMAALINKKAPAVTPLNFTNSNTRPTFASSPRANGVSDNETKPTASGVSQANGAIGVPKASRKTTNQARLIRKSIATHDSSGTFGVNSPGIEHQPISHIMQMFKKTEQARQRQQERERERQRLIEETKGEKAAAEADKAVGGEAQTSAQLARASSASSSASTASGTASTSVNAGNHGNISFTRTPTAAHFVPHATFVPPVVAGRSDSGKKSAKNTSGAAKFRDQAVHLTSIMKVIPDGKREKKDPKSEKNARKSKTSSKETKSKLTKQKDGEHNQAVPPGFSPSSTSSPTAVTELTAENAKFTASNSSPNRSGALNGSPLNNYKKLSAALNYTGRSPYTSGKSNESRFEQHSAEGHIPSMREFAQQHASPSLSIDGGESDEVEHKFPEQEKGASAQQKASSDLHKLNSYKKQVALQQSKLQCQEEQMAAQRAAYGEKIGSQQKQLQLQEEKLLLQRDAFQSAMRQVAERMGVPVSKAVTSVGENLGAERKKVPFGSGSSSSNGSGSSSANGSGSSSASSSSTGNGAALSASTEGTAGHASRTRVKSAGAEIPSNTRERKDSNASSVITVNSYHSSKNSGKRATSTAGVIQKQKIQKETISKTPSVDNSKASKLETPNDRLKLLKRNAKLNSKITVTTTTVPTTPATPAPNHNLAVQKPQNSAVVSDTDPVENLETVQKLQKSCRKETSKLVTENRRLKEEVTELRKKCHTVQGMAALR